MVRDGDGGRAQQTFALGTRRRLLPYPPSCDVGYHRLADSDSQALTAGTSAHALERAPVQAVTTNFRANAGGGAGCSGRSPAVRPTPLATRRNCFEPNDFGASVGTNGKLAAEQGAILVAALFAVVELPGLVAADRAQRRVLGPGPRPGVPTVSVRNLGEASEPSQPGLTACLVRIMHLLETGGLAAAIDGRAATPARASAHTREGLLWRLSGGVGPLSIAARHER